MRLRARLEHLFLFRRGRPVALALLLVLVACNWASDQFGKRSPHATRHTASRVIASITAPFPAMRQQLFDAYLRSFVRQRKTQPVTVVEIDEPSLRVLGQWPWPRNRLADLIDAVASASPAAIGLDVYMPEPDQTSPDRVATNLPAHQEALAAALAQLPSHELRLAQSLRRAPTVLGAVGFDFGTQVTQTGLRSVPMTTSGGDPLPLVRAYTHVLASMPELQVAASGQGVASVDVDESAVRRVPMVVSVGGQLVPSLAMEMLRVATGSSRIDVTVGQHGVERVSTADLSVQTQSEGDIWLHFSRYAQGQQRSVSAVDVLGGKVPPEALAGKLVLIGLTGNGLYDTRLTALGDVVPGVEIQAQILESFFDQRFVLRPWWMVDLELALTLVAGIGMIWLVPRSRAHFNSMSAMGREPNGAGWAVLAANAALLGAGFILFDRSGLLLDSSACIATCALLMANLVFSSLLEIESENRHLAHEQKQLIETTARAAGELEAARRVQLASLPDASRAFAGETRFDLAALLEPAHESGGDLYDFFMLNAHHLCLVIGDVSGKGMPAAVFMAMTKSLVKSLALRLGGGPDAVVAAANADLGRDNTETLFVTLLVLVLNVETGSLMWVNAGHDAPWRIDAGGAHRLNRADFAGDPPLCVVEAHVFTCQHAQLNAGEALCMVTDGITEAMNPSGTLYGQDRVTVQLQSAARHATAQQLLDRLHQDVAGFVKGAEPSDDLTLLVLRWHGPRAGSAGPNAPGPASGVASSAAASEA